MKKKLGFLGLLTTFLLFFTTSVQATGLLSPAIELMQKECAVLKTGVGKNTVSFTADDFLTVFGESEYLGIVITELPALSDGVLKLGALDVSKGQIIARDAIAALRFVPSEAGKTASFGFLPYGKSYESDFVCTVYMLDALNFAPTASGSIISAVENIPFYGTLSASDPDGDSLQYELEKKPEKGSLTLSADGSYCYTAYAGETGQDRFSYTAVDPYGNRSAVTTVVIETEKNVRGIEYVDLTNAKEAHSAVFLASQDALIGEKIGTEWYFYPEKTVTRGEFLMMAMKLNDMEPALFAADESGFADGASFSETENEYITAAAGLGIVVGMDTENGRCFLPNEPITAAQASTIISRIASLRGLPFGKAVLASADADAEISEEGMEVLSAAGFAVAEDRHAVMTRADAAEMLYRLSAEK